VNEELRRIWQERNGHDPDAARKIAASDGKIANIRRAIEDGLSDAVWANARLGELQAERTALVKAAAATGEPPQVDIETALAHRRNLDRVLAQATPQERKRFVRTWVDEIKLAPEQREVVMTYRIPEPVMNVVVAGARSVVEKKISGDQVTAKVTRYEAEEKHLGDAAEIDELIRVVFGPERASLVPV
jgi:hypothetical protein